MSFKEKRAVTFGLDKDLISFAEKKTKDNCFGVYVNDLIRTDVLRKKKDKEVKQKCLELIKQIQGSVTECRTKVADKSISKDFADGILYSELEWVCRMLDNIRKTVNGKEVDIE